MDLARSTHEFSCRSRVKPICSARLAGSDLIHADGFRCARPVKLFSLPSSAAALPSARMDLD
jgi:hypothetical protein